MSIQLYLAPYQVIQWTGENFSEISTVCEGEGCIATQNEDNSVTIKDYSGSFVVVEIPALNWYLICAPLNANSQPMSATEDIASLGYYPYPGN